MTGKHRKPGPLTLTFGTTGGLIIGAAVLGTAAATAQAGVVNPGPAPKAPAPKAAAWSGKTAELAARVSGAPEARGLAKAPAKAAAKAKAKASNKRQHERKRKLPTAADTVGLATKQVGITEAADGSTKFQQWYMTTERAKETVQRDGGSISGYKGAAWCSMFLSWVGESLGISDQIGSDAWTIGHARWFQQQKRWGTKPYPGAIVFFDWAGGKTNPGIDHVGMVVKDRGDGTVDTVEGNTDNAVKLRNRPLDKIVGFGYPKYAK
ncbi:CHAP domain-containing protein [Spirillospora sp. CA-294931]|uniref:CHAP domain-containing protein n=1 Tax=Spirillospora sp. CA-294931 TaxID=3240042 RepID=UPI003D935D4C